LMLNPAFSYPPIAEKFSIIDKRTKHG